MIRFLHLSRRSLILFIIPLLLVAQTALAQDNGVNIDVRVGFDGYYREAYWVPVQIEVANDGPNIAGEIQILTGNDFNEDEVIYSAPMLLSNQSNKRVTLYIRLGPIVDELVVSLVDENGRLIHRKTTATPLRNWSLQGQLYGVVSTQPDDYLFLERAIESNAGTAVAFLTLDELPDLTNGWQALNALVLHDVDTTTLSSSQRTALQNWVNRGGQLYVVGGPNWQKTTAALSTLLPVVPSGSESRAELPDFTSQMGIPFRDAGPYVLTNSALQNGELLYHEDGEPIVARRRWGRGSIFFLALDPSLAPLVDWDGSDLLWQDMASTRPDFLPWGLGVQNYYAATTAVSSLPSLALPSFTALIIFLVAYIALVGPINYFVLKRIERPELAWVTIPAIIGLFTVGTYITGFQLKGNDTIINQMSIVYGDIGGEDELQVQSLIGLYSPRRTVYDLILPLNTAVQPVSDGFTTIDNRFDSISRSINTVVSGIRTDVGGIKTFIADSFQPPPLIEGEASLLLSETQLNLAVTVKNNTDVDLDKAALLFGETIIPLGTLNPGEESSIKQQIGQGEEEVDIGIPSLTPERGARSPLAVSPEILLGTGDYYNDPEAFPRWQILQALDTSNRLFLDATLSTETVTLIAWTQETQIDIGLDRGEFETMATTLYLLDIPVDQAAIRGQTLTVPRSSLNWRVVDNAENVFEPDVENLFLNGGWVDVEFQPRGEFADIAVSTLTVLLTPQDTESEQPVPDLSLWDWEKEAWVPLEGVDWGETAVSLATTPALANAISDKNVVRLRIEDASLLGTNIGEAFLHFTGNLE